MRANMMQPMPYGMDGPFSVSAPLADGGLMRRGPLGRRMPYMPTAPFGIPGQPQSTGGYDSSGINPHGMYNGTFGQPQMPHNPGGFQPMGGLTAMFNRYRGS
jgi:hypothetical protein